MAQQAKDEAMLKSKQSKPLKNDPPAQAGSAANLSPSDRAMQQVLRHAEAGHYDEALSVLLKAGREPRLQNARGVCLMRSGRAEEAVRQYRSFMLGPGGIYMKDEMPIEYKVNFATALLLAGNIPGGAAVLDEIATESDPGVRRLRAALVQWTKDLSLWQRFNWWTARVAPAGKPISLDGELGQFA